MGRRYFCDYCNRSFIDELQSRKKHLKSAAHQNLRNLYFAAFRDLKTVVEEEKVKNKCPKFFNTGSCSFDPCIFSHYSDYELQLMHKEVEEKERRPIRVPTVENWLAKRASRGPSQTAEELVVPVHSLPLGIDGLILPPSLQPLTADMVRDLNISQWGV